MSVTSVLSQNKHNIKQFLTAIAPKPKIIIPNQNIITKYNETSTASLLGTMYDYALRIKLWQTLPQNKIKSATWIVEKLINNGSKIYFYMNQFWDSVINELNQVLKINILSPFQMDLIKNITIPCLKKFVKNSNKFINQNLNWDSEADLQQLYVWSYFASKYDEFYRSGLPPLSITAVQQLSSSYLYEDFMTLVKNLDSFLIVVAKECYLNPDLTDPELLETLGKGDADLIVDQNLMDFKTTKRLEFTPVMWWQLVIYKVLAWKKNIIVDTGMIWYAKYNYLLKINFNLDEKKLDAIYQFLKIV